MADHLDDILFTLGAALMTIGAGLIYLPAAFLVAGAFCIAGGVIYGRFLAVRETASATLTAEEPEE